MAEIPPLKLEGIRPQTKRNASAWSEAPADTKNSWAKSAIDHLLINKVYMTTNELMGDVYSLLAINGAFVGRGVDQGKFISDNPGISATATAALKAVNPNADKSAATTGSTAKSAVTELDTLSKSKQTNTIIIIVAVVVVLAVVTFMFLKKK